MTSTYAFLASRFSKGLRLAGILKLVDFYLITRHQPISFVGHADPRLIL